MRSEVILFSIDSIYYVVVSGNIIRIVCLGILFEIDFEKGMSDIIISMILFRVIHLSFVAIYLLYFV